MSMHTHAAQLRRIAGQLGDLARDIGQHLAGRLEAAALFALVGILNATASRWEGEQ